ETCSGRPYAWVSSSRCSLLRLAKYSASTDLCNNAPLLCPLQFCPAPVTEIRPGLIGTLQEFEQCGFRRRRLPDVVVHQQKFLHFRMIKRLGGSNFALRESRRF